MIRNWRTGAQVATAVLRGGIEAYDLRPDGGDVLSQEGAGVHVVRPGAAPRELTRRGTEARWAGEHIVFRAGDGRLRVIDPGGRARDFGAPSALIESFVTDDRRVLWGANGCLLVADVTARAARAPAPGPCPRSEVAMRDGQPLGEPEPPRAGAAALRGGGAARLPRNAAARAGLRGAAVGRVAEVAFPHSHRPCPVAPTAAHPARVGGGPARGPDRHRRRRDASGGRHGRPRGPA